MDSHLHLANLQTRKEKRMKKEEKKEAPKKIFVLDKGVDLKNGEIHQILCCAGPFGFMRGV